MEKGVSHYEGDIWEGGGYLTVLSDSGGVSGALESYSVCFRREL